MIIITVLGLITKRLLLQSIHNELCDKYKREDLIFYKINSICNLLDLQDFNILTFSAACWFLLILIIFSKRITFLKNKLNGYVAPVVPVDFFIHVKRKFTAVIFAIIADELLRIVNQVINGTSVKVDGVIVVYLLQIVEVFVIGVRYYPILSAIYMDSILSLVCATFYAWFDFSFTTVNHSLCQSDFYSSDNDFKATNGSYIKRLFQYYGTGQNLIIIQLLMDIPRYICWSYVVMKLYQYFQSCILIVPLLDGLQTTLQALIDAVSSVGQDGSKQSEVLFPNLIRSFVTAILTACVRTVIQILVILANIRRNLFQIFSGDDSKILKRNKEKYIDCGIGNVHFVDFIIGYLIWGYVLITLFT
ncbi:unnamed protein product [Rotaria magnacalcarata]